ncbi:hypothetical protein [Hyphobacterium sp.]|uniref:hypothetical protein n=1 Tax=Hyphobacterium sp. TaxID=2004662 RepID=UPI003BAA7323
MVEFLISIFEWLGSFAMLFLGISYVEPVSCDAVPELLQIHYTREETAESTVSTDCVGYELNSEAPVQVYRI